MSRVSQEELYDDKDVVTQILKLKDTVNDYAGGIIENIDVSGNDLVIDWASGESVSLPLPSPTGIGSVTGAVSGGNLIITFYMTDGSSHAFTCPLTGMATEAYVDTGLATKADDSAVVKLAGAQSVTGVKTFTVSPSVPLIPSGPTAAVSDAYVNDASPNANNIAHKTGNETIAGTKTFQGSIIEEQNMIRRYTNFDIENPPTGGNQSTGILFMDMNNVEMARLLIRLNANKSTAFQLWVKNANGTTKIVNIAEGDP